MKIAILTAAAALFATPLVAQTTPGTAPASSDQTTTATPADPAATTAPAAGADPSSPAPTPNNGQAMPNGQMQNGQMSGGQMPMANDTPPATASTGNLPYCRSGQYTGCREHSNAAGARVHKKHR